MLVCILTISTVMVGAASAQCTLPAELPAATQFADGNPGGRAGECVLGAYVWPPVPASLIFGHRACSPPTGRSWTLALCSGGVLDGAGQGPCTIECVAGQAQSADGVYAYVCTGQDMPDPTPECTRARSSALDHRHRHPAPAPRQQRRRMTVTCAP
jgi:hypothetical protein